MSRYQVNHLLSRRILYKDTEYICDELKQTLIYMLQNDDIKFNINEDEFQ